MVRLLFIYVLMLFVIQAFSQTQKIALPAVNYEALVSRASLTYSKPVNRSEEGMPVGNGRMGSLVWTTPSAIRFQLNRVDVFGNNSASNNFYERHTDYCSGVGFVELDFLNEENFTSKKFRQHLSCYDGIVEVEGETVKAQVLAWNERDVMAVKIKNSSPTHTVQINLRSLRAPVSKRGNHQAISTLKVVDNKIIIVQEFKEDKYYCSSSVVIDVPGIDAKASLVNETTVRLSIPPGKADFTVMMSSAATFSSESDVIGLSMENLEAAKKLGFDGLYQSNRLWWKYFWEKSYVQLDSKDGVANIIEKNYTYYVYVMASSSRGLFPPKFNGMLWSTGGDVRKWGNLFWGANQSCLYNALQQANRDELMAPMFNMYSAMRNSCEIAAQQQWGSKGIFIPETVAFDGMTALPDSIASEMRDLYLLRKPWSERTQTFIDYTSTKMPFQSRWNWKKDEGWREGRWMTSDKGAGAFGHVTHIFSRGAKIAYQYWLKYEYTQDKEWLVKEAYPMLKGVAEFYRNFPHLKKEEDGKYHIRHINDNESILDGHNTVEEISAMMGIFPVAIKASEILNVDSDLRQLWKEVLNNLSPLPLSNLNSATLPDTWIRSLPPFTRGEGNSLPDANTLPVWFFDLCTLESDAATRKTANATFNAYFPKGIDATTPINVLSKLPIAGSQLGHTASTKHLILNQIETTEIDVMPNRMDLREGDQATSVQRLGRAADALQNALCQSVPSRPGQETVIRIFPAWPTEWDAQFKLLCRGGFLVSASMQNGIIEAVDIKSIAGSICRIRNPWPNQQVTIYRNAKKWKTSKGDLLVFPTNKNEHFELRSRR